MSNATFNLVKLAVLIAVDAGIVFAYDRFCKKINELDEEG